MHTATYTHAPMAAISPPLACGLSRVHEPPRIAPIMAPMAAPPPPLACGLSRVHPRIKPPCIKHVTLLMGVLIDCEYFFHRYAKLSALLIG